MYRLPFLEGIPDAANRNALGTPAHEVHLDAPLLLIVDRFVTERCHIEVGTCLSICTMEEVQIKRCSHALGIVISCPQHLNVLLQIDPDKKDAVGAERVSEIAQEGDGIRWM